MPAPLVLSFHAGYFCQHRGACCAAGWPIPIEAHQLAEADRALADGRLTPAVRGTVIFVRPGDAPVQTPALLGSSAGACVFLHPAAGGGRCGIHRVLGHAALPLACRQFPRVSIVDPRGTSVTLSHYCPTAAKILDTRRREEGEGAKEHILTPDSDPPIALVTSAWFPADAEYVGLDARTALPPLLRPDMLMDWESWWRWERESVAIIDSCPTAADALARLGAAVEHARTWQPADGPLAARIEAAFAHARTSPASERMRPAAATLAAWIDTAIPVDARRARQAGTSARASTTEGVRRRFLAAHTFANWTAYTGQGLRSWLRSLEAADALLELGFPPGEADLRLRHLADADRLTEIWSAAERE